MKITIETDNPSEATVILHRIKEHEIILSIFNRIKKIPYTEEIIPCEYCGDFGHNPDCTWFKFESRIREEFQDILGG